jgi:hypothetical protein
MANQEHLEILRQGVKGWNQWREEHREIQPDLSGLDLSESNLNWVHLGAANLSRMDLRGADLSSADFRGADLSESNLNKVTANWTNFIEANLIKADLSGANLKRAKLNRAKLNGANLSETDLSRADLSGADLSETIMSLTTFGDVDLREVYGLESVRHFAQLHIDIHTIYRSQGKIPEVFLRGAGIPDTFIAYITSLTDQAIQYYSCFISYSSKDEAFAQRLHADLQQKGVRCWFAPEDMKIGDKIRPIIDQSIRVHDKLLLVLSEHSINSTWVEKEVETAFEEEHRRKQTVLFPVRLDEAVMETDQAWAANIRDTRHVGDFSRWKDHDAYQQAFERLLRDLKAEV